MLAGVSVSGYYAWRKRESKRVLREAADVTLRDHIVNASGVRIGISGYRTVSMYFLGVNHKRIARIMKKYELQAHIRRANPYLHMYKKTQGHEAVPNLLLRNFAQLTPGRSGGTDITYLRWRKSFVYLSFVKDFASSEALSWNASMTLAHSLVIDTVEQLKVRLGTDMVGFMLHSDQGWHYSHPKYRSLLKEHGVIQSMSRKGNCIDNAKTETFFGHMKDELSLNDCETFEEVVRKIDAFMYYYNNMRRMWSKEKMTPVEYRSHLLSSVNV